MGNRNLLFESIFNRKFSDEDTRDFLEQITNDYPYFSPAQYFLLLKADKQSPAYTQQVAKTSVLFNNPHWLKFQLEEYERNPSELSNSIVTNSNEVVFAESPAMTYPEFKAHAETTSKNELSPIESLEQEATFQQPKDFVIINEATEPAIEAASTANDLENIAVGEIESEVKEFEIEPIVEDASMRAEDSLVNEKNKYQNEVKEVELEPIVEKELAHGEETLVNEENELQLEVKEVEPKLIINVATTLADLRLVNEESESKIEGDNTEDKKQKREIKETVHPGHFNNDNNPLVNEPENDEDISSAKDDTVPLSFKLNIDTSGTTQDTISFEPLHATDYFASLGIKLSGEIQPTDKLGKQLKSFTEWLKTMKKIHRELEEKQNGQAEITIQKLAENSNQQQEVVTESMADVLLLQGKAKKAIELYKKLSLLDNSKSAYFAAKIDQLKEH